jgi:hypothetical protein
MTFFYNYRHFKLWHNQIKSKCSCGSHHKILSVASSLLSHEKVELWRPHCNCTNMTNSSKNIVSKLACLKNMCDIKLTNQKKWILESSKANTANKSQPKSVIENDISVEK